jgi:hypothetical protein
MTFLAPFDGNKSHGSHLTPVIGSHARTNFTFGTNDDRGSRFQRVMADKTEAMLTKIEQPAFNAAGLPLGGQQSDLAITIMADGISFFLQLDHVPILFGLRTTTLIERSVSIVGTGNDAICVGG